MTKKSIYLKYREERDYAKFLKDFKKNTWQIKKVARVRLERVDLNALMKQKPSVPVSLPIKHFNKMRSNMSNNHDGQKELQILKDKIGRRVRQDVGPVAPATNLRMVRHPDGTTMIKNIPIIPNLLPVNFTLPDTREAEKKSEKVETYTPTNAIITDANANVMPFQRNDQISMKRQPTKENYGIAHRKVSSSNSKEVETYNPNDVIDIAAKANVMPFQEDDIAEKANVMPFQRNYQISMKRTPINENYGIAHRKVSSSNSKEVETNNPNDAIDTAAKAKPFHGDDHISINYPYYPQEIDTAEKANVMLFQRNDQISMKRLPTNENYGIAHRKVSSPNFKEVETNNTSDAIVTAAKAKPFQGDDHINTNYPYYPQEIDTAEKVNVMPYGIAHRKISFKNSKEVGTNTSTDIIDTGGMSNEYISIKHKLPVPVAPTKENYGIAHREVSFINSKHVGTSTSTDIINRAAKSNERIAYKEINSANEVKRCLKALVITSTQTDKIPIVNEKELQILGIVTKSGVTNDELVDALESFKKVKELSKYNVTEVIDLDDSADNNGTNLLELARFHSEKNKKAIYKNCAHEPNLTSTKSAPTPTDLEQEKILEEMRNKLINSMNYEQLKNMIDSQEKNNNKENSNKKRKTTESGDCYDEANMEMQIDVPDTQNIMNQPITIAPLLKPPLQKSTTQQSQMQPIKAQKQNKESSLPQLHSLPIQQIIRQDAHLECLQRQKMQQQQFLQKLKQQNMRAKPKQPQSQFTTSAQYTTTSQEQSPQLINLQTQQPHSKSPQILGLYSNTPQFQPPHSKSPQDQQPQPQPAELQEQLQHPLDRRIRIRDQQRAALPQQHYEYESASNGYQNSVFSQVPQTVNSTQQPQFQIYPRDPRIQTYQSQMSQVMPSAPRLMSTYEANLQTSGSSYPYQNNCYINQQYW